MSVYTQDELKYLHSAYDHGVAVASGQSSKGAREYRGDAMRVYYRGVEGLPSGLPPL